MPETTKSAELTEKIVGRQISLQKLQDFIIEAQTHGVEMNDKVNIRVNGQFIYQNEVKGINLTVPIPSELTYAPVVGGTVSVPRRPWTAPSLVVIELIVIALLVLAILFL